MASGLLLIDKPEDWTSFDAVNYVRRIVANKEQLKPKQVKVGHSGTLDPFATGLLILLVGKDYTKRAAEFTKQDKTYTFSLMLGKSSTTGDSTGTISEVSDKKPTLEEVEEVIKSFIGTIKQIPPIYSAIKINGVRAYKLARQGKEANIQPREITVYSLNLISYDYPKVELRANVSSGTYIRTLGVDIGEALGSGAYVASLRRESIGEFNVRDSKSPKQLDQDNIEQFIRS